MPSPQPAPKRVRMVTEDMILSRDWHRRQIPRYAVNEAAKAFFGMSASWLRLKLNPSKGRPNTSFVDEKGERLAFRRLDPDPEKTSARVILLSDIEPMAWSLFKFGDIDQAKLVKILRVVQAEAELYGLFDEPGDSDGKDPEDAGEPKDEPAAQEA